MRDNNHPTYGQLWEYQGREVFVLGNSPSEDGRTIWSAERQTGRRIDAVIEAMTPTSTSGATTLSELVNLSTAWARDGNSDASWWLGWWFEGVNHPKSIWYYIAAIRLNADCHGWAIDRIAGDARFGCMCSGTPQPDISFLKGIPELCGKRISPDWMKAIENAESAVHQPASAAQIEQALKYYRNGMSPRVAALKADITEQCLTASEGYRSLEADSWSQPLTENAKVNFEDGSKVDFDVPF